MFFVNRFLFVNRLLFATTLALVPLAVVCSSPAWAQASRTVSTISGTVMDSSGAVIPNARVVLKDEGTGLGRETVTNPAGGFVFPDLKFGSYEVTVSITGFQTVVYRNVVVEASRTTDLPITMAVGTVADRVEVTGVAPTLEVTSNIVSRTVAQESLETLPLLGRSTLAFGRLVPGTSTPTGGDTHFNGLPGGAIYVTTDGINNASNGWKSGGTSFYAAIVPRVDSTEELIVETSGLGADAGAQSGANMKFITRRGTNHYHGGLFYQPQNEFFYANTWRNNALNQARTKSRDHFLGGHIGGPLIPIQTLGLKDKLFFFVNLEMEYAPGESLQTHNIMLPQTQQGAFLYQTASGEIRSANLLDIAAKNGFPNALDPITQNLITQQNKALQYGRLIPIAGNPRQQQLQWVEPQTIRNEYPTTRVDYQITPKIAWFGTWSLEREITGGRRLWPLPDTPPQYQFKKHDWLWSLGLNWTINPRTLNDFRYGTQHTGDTTPNTGAGFYTQNGKPMRLSTPYLDQMLRDKAPITGRHYISTIFDTLTLIRGSHTITAGGTFRSTDWKDAEEAGPAGILGAPLYTVGLGSGDPASAIFNATTLPGIQSPDIAQASSLYAVLVGRLSQVQDGRVVDPQTRQYGGQINLTWTRSYMGGMYVQDAWRMRPNFTLNFGLRYEMQGDQFNVNGITAFPDLANLLGPSVGLFQPGVLSGITDPVNKVGQHASTADLFNLAPNFGFAWQPKLDAGPLGKILGSGKTVIRGGAGVIFYDEGSNFFASNPGSNPGKTQSLLIRAGQEAPFGTNLQSTLPAFAAFPAAFVQTFRQADFTGASYSGTYISQTATFSTMMPHLKAPYILNWNFGIQRELAKNTVLEVRYVGNGVKHIWRTTDMNEVNIFENGFLKEFKNAQNNLAINTANGVANNFSNRGLPGQVGLPILEAAFGARGSQAALATGSGFGSSTFVTALQNGTAGSMAQSLATNQLYVCRMFGNTFSPCATRGYNAPGPYPINFFLTNPFAAGGLGLVEDASSSSYHGLQTNFRRRVQAGLTLQANYTWSKNLGDLWANSSTQTRNFRTLRDGGLDKAPAPHDVRHVFQTAWTYELPIGKDRTFAPANRVLNTIGSGWMVSGILTVQSGQAYYLSSGRSTVNGSDSGVYLQQGLTAKDLQNMSNFSQGPITNRYWFDPKLIGADGRANPNYIAVPTDPGQFGQFVYLYGKNNFSFDASLSKIFRITEQIKLEFWGAAQNVLNHPVWNASGFLGAPSIQSTTFGQSTSPANSARGIQFRGILRF